MSKSVKILFCILLFSTACFGNAQVKVIVGDKVVSAEIADTPEAREKGLMFRESLGKFSGMLFVWQEDVHNSFWMKNTPLTLDIIFINSAKQIVHIAPYAKPLSLDYISSPKSYRYVLEVNGGSSHVWGLKEGDLVSFEK
ncbi:DUF192 domain-containing protein [bacterium]|nr:DUF192 domain-containing protein [bacterium]